MQVTTLTVHSHREKELQQTAKLYEEVSSQQLQNLQQRLEERRKGEYIEQQNCYYHYCVQKGKDYNRRPLKD